MRDGGGPAGRRPAAAGEEVLTESLARCCGDGGDGDGGDGSVGGARGGGGEGGLETLQLGFCGRGAGDRLLEALAGGGGGAAGLRTLALGGCYRVSDRGVAAAVRRRRGWCW